MTPPAMASSRAAPSGATGRGDLLRLLLARGEEELPRLAGLLGYGGASRPPQARAQGTPDADGWQAKPAGEPSLPGEKIQWAPLPCWRLEQVEELEEPEVEEPTGLPTLHDLDVTPRAQAPPRSAPIVPWSRLWPALHGPLRDHLPSREIDTRALVDCWGRGEIPPRIPRLPAAAWTRRLNVWVDRRPALIPFWDDQDALLRRLRRQLGRASLRVSVSRHGPGGPWSAAGRGSRRPEPGDVVLALSDLGVYADAAERQVWAEQARRLRRAGVRLHALVPCPASRWWPALARLWGAVDWSAPRLGAARARAVSGGEEGLSLRHERLLRLLSPAIRVEPGLLRQIRRLLPAQAADIGTEADVWGDARVRGGSSVAMSFQAGAAAEPRQGFAREPEGMRQRVAAAIATWHAHLPREIWLEEALAMGPATSGEAEATLHRFMLAVCGSLLGQDNRGERPLHWYRRAGGRLPEKIWADPALRSAMARAWKTAWAGEDKLPLPPGVPPAFLSALPEGAVRRPWQVRQVGGELVFLPLPGSDAQAREEAASAEAELPQVGSPVAPLLAARPEVAIGNPAGAGGELLTLQNPRPTHPIPQEPSLHLTTDRQRLTLVRQIRPPWARAQGRDRFGLWCEVAVGEVVFRLRWIPPGTFWMGSPETEEGRWEAEGPRHQVTLTEGYWLAETPCTQALWQRVMGKNPSRFKSPDRPVEQVSWKDCQDFLGKLNQEAPELGASLPTEAQWEYACRAGTMESTYAGELEILGSNNGPVLDPIAWYGGNSGKAFDLDEGWDSTDWPEKQYPHTRAGTRPVEQKERNPWGLYDMLGNVWEWCADGQRRYGEGAVKDPHGSSEAGSGRVVRGGSWFSDARDVRAAARSAFVPGERFDSLGFRLARGQQP